MTWQVLPLSRPQQCPWSHLMNWDKCLRTGGCGGLSQRSLAPSVFVFLAAVQIPVTHRGKAEKSAGWVQVPAPIAGDFRKYLISLGLFPLLRKEMRKPTFCVGSNLCAEPRTHRSSVDLGPLI